MSVDGDESINRAAFAGVTALTVLTWYALPDAVRSRPLRTAIKVGLLGVTAAGAAMIPAVYPVRSKPAEPLLDLAKPVVALLGLGAAAGAGALTVRLEQVIFERGERRRAEGVRCAHSRLAAVLAVACGAAALPDWPNLAASARSEAGA